MNADGIFLKSGGELAVLKQTAYETEDVLQRALAEHPDVVAGPTTSGGEPRPLLLVRREMGVPGAVGGSARWRSLAVAVMHSTGRLDGIRSISRTILG